jgi:hypothetical protein
MALSLYLFCNSILNCCGFCLNCECGSKAETDHESKVKNQKIEKSKPEYTTFELPVSLDSWDSD